MQDRVDKLTNVFVCKQNNGKSSSQELQKLSDAAQLRPEVVASLSAAVQAFRQGSPQHEVHKHLHCVGQLATPHHT